MPYVNARRRRPLIAEQLIDEAVHWNATSRGTSAVVFNGESRVGGVGGQGWLLLSLSCDLLRLWLSRDMLWLRLARLVECEWLL